jgi:hypothetical protein
MGVSRDRESPAGGDARRRVGRLPACEPVAREGPGGPGAPDQFRRILFLPKPGRRTALSGRCSPGRAARDDANAPDCPEASDCLSRATSRIRQDDGRLYISLRQQKTGKLIDVPVHSALEPLLRERLASDWKPKPLSSQRRYRNTTDTVLLVPSPTGKRWAYRNFCRAWDLVTKKVGIEGLQPRDLRRTGIVRLAEAGATTPQIDALSGHGIDYCQKVIETYLPRRTEAALGAIKLWASATATSKVVRLLHHSGFDNQ